MNLSTLAASLPHLTAITGGGGKTTLMLALATLAARQGKSVLLTTTTHLAWPPPQWLPLCPPEEIAAQRPAPGQLLLCGSPCSPRRMTGLPPEEIAPLPFDVILVEADGSAHLPLKVHRVDEPVIPPGTDFTIQVAGLSALGRPVKETVHRHSLAGLTEAELVTPALVARLLLLGQARCPSPSLALLNQADAPAEREAGAEIAALLAAAHCESLVCSLREEGAPCWC